MNIYTKNLTIRNALEDDAVLLCRWWNDGNVMAHAGFPNGLNVTPERVKESIGKNTDSSRLHIIELNNIPIGEMNYRDVGNETVAIGIKICNSNEQNKGYGTLLLSYFIDSLFRYYGYEKVLLDTNIKNTRAQYVYETKLGFSKVAVKENSWQDQNGQWQTSIHYEMTKSRWYETSDVGNGYIHIRLEGPLDYYTVESLTRDAFWKNSANFTNEHLLVRRLRESEFFVPELDFVAKISGKIVGNIIYSICYLEDSDMKRYEVLTFGPLSVLPEYQNSGVGRALLNHSISIARTLGYIGIVFYGHPDYYTRVGFKRGRDFGITTPSGNAPDPFMAMPLYPNAFDRFYGSRFFDNDVFLNIDDEKAAMEFDKQFPPKKRYEPVPISVILNRLAPAAKAALEELKVESIDRLSSKSEDFMLSLPGMDSKAVDIIKAVMKDYGFRWGK